MTPPRPLGQTLAIAIAQVRATIGDPVAPVVVLTPSQANGTLARQQLALATDFIRVEFLSPEGWLRELGRGPLAARGLRAEPAGWLRTTVAALTRELAATGALGPHADVLVQPGWSAALARAVDSLQAAGIDADALARVHTADQDAQLAILATLLRRVGAQRGIDRVYAVSDLAAAVRGVAPDRRWRGAVVLGDRLLAPQVHQGLAAWLAQVPHAEVRLAPWRHLEPAPHGLRAAVSGDVLEVPATGGSRLVALGEGLFAPAPGPAPAHDDSAILARTPDDVRELHEAARAVLDGIRRGIPLDRIAVVLPDAAEVDVLRSHLSAAGVPATWLIGPPLGTRPAAGFLGHALEIAAGDDTVPAWYDLLRQPGLQLGTAIGADVTEGRGRWRRILSRCGAVRDTAAIVRAIEAWAARIDEAAFDPEGDRRAAANLVRAIRGVDAALTGLRTAATLGEHGRRWRELLGRFWGPSPDREQVRGALASWGAPGLGGLWSLPEGLGELREALDGTAALQGRLGDPAVRVGTPMGLLGGAFDLVVVTGLTEGRLPQRPGEDPLLPDALIDTINQQLGTRLLGSAELASFEARRFAAVVGACTGQLWLSSPATELLEERPLLPSRFALEVASVLQGRRARYRDLAALQIVSGSRARPWSPDPGRAVGTLEHRVATVASDPEGGLRRLARHAVGRRLLGLHRALDHDGPTPWTGLLPVGILPVPGLDGTPLPPHQLGKLVRDPGAFLVDEVLGVRRMPGLYGSSDPSRRRLQDGWLVDAVEAGLDGPDPPPVACLDAWDEAMAVWREHRSDVDDTVVGLVRRIADHRVADLWSAGLVPYGVRHPVQGAPVDGLPWTVEAELAWVDGDVLRALRAERPKRQELCRDAPDLVLGALVAPGVEQIHVGGLDGKATTGRVDAEGPRMVRWLHLVTTCVQAGYWPQRRAGSVHLKAEGERDYTAEDHVDQALATRGRERR